MKSRGYHEKGWGGGDVWIEEKGIQLPRAINILGPFNPHGTRGCMTINDQNK